MILLDTHVLIWWAAGDNARLSTAARSAIAEAAENSRLLISAISAWEVAQLVDRGRLALAMDVSAWLAKIGEISAVRFVSVDPEIAVKSVELPGVFHKDPADRIIVATARQLAVPLVTADEKILSYAHVRVIAA